MIDTGTVEMTTGAPEAIVKQPQITESNLFLQHDGLRVIGSIVNPDATVDSDTVVSANGGHSFKVSKSEQGNSRLTIARAGITHNETSYTSMNTPKNINVIAAGVIHDTLGEDKRVTFVNPVEVLDNGNLMVNGVIITAEGVTTFDKVIEADHGKRTEQEQMLYDAAKLAQTLRKNPDSKEEVTE